MGWATEYGAVKFDVSMDETDLRRILRELTGSPEPAQQLTSAEAFQLLELEARLFAEAESVRVVPDAERATVVRRVQAAKKAREDFRAKLVKELNERAGTGA